MEGPLRRALAVLLLAATASVSAPGAAPADMPEIQARGTLRVLSSVDEEPEMFNFRPEGEPGFERELVEGFAKLHGLRVECVQVARFEDIIPRLLEGDGDLVTGIVDTEARRHRIDFTVEVLPARHVAVTEKPHRAVASVEQFRKERVGVVQGTSWAAAAVAAGVPAPRIRAFPDAFALFEALHAGKISATVMSVSDLTLALRRRPDLEAGVFLGPPASSGWGVRKQDRALHAALDAHLSDARKGGTWSRLVVKYFGRDALEVLGRAGGR